MIVSSIITDFAAGDDLEIQRTIDSIPSGTSLDTAWFMVKRKYSDPDADALITKTITSAIASGEGVINDNGINDGMGQLSFYLSTTETGLLTPLSEYPFTIKLKLNNGKVGTPEGGVIIANPAVKQGNV